MKHYQDHDPLHGTGKAIPKPKASNPLRIVSRFEKHSEHPLTTKPFKYPPTRRQKQEATKARKKLARQLAAIA